jgi:hypothetical protein
MPDGLVGETARDTWQRWTERANRLGRAGEPSSHDPVAQALAAACAGPRAPERESCLTAGGR